MTVPMFAIILNLATPEQREQVHAIVRENANGWWHGFADVWIAGGKSAVEWRDLVGAAVPTVTTGGGILVLKIDSDSSGTWASWARLSDEAKNWLKTNL